VATYGYRLDEIRVAISYNTSGAENAIGFPTTFDELPIDDANYIELVVYHVISLVVLVMQINIIIVY